MSDGEALIELTPRLLLSAYAQGIFPMGRSRESDEIDWFSPESRALIPLDRYHVPRSLERTIRQGVFEIRQDTAFEAVIRGCAQPRAGEAQTWINSRIIAAFCELHRLGFAHSIECWREGVLQGGLYGVSLGGAFFGESMYRDRNSQASTNASKVALVKTCEHLRARGYRLFDVQIENAHLRQFGLIEISREAYLSELERAIVMPVRWR